MAESQQFAAKKSKLEADDFDLDGCLSHRNTSWSDNMIKQQLMESSKFDSGVSLSYRDDSVSTGNDVRHHLRSSYVTDVGMDAAIDRLHIGDVSVTSLSDRMACHCSVKVHDDELFQQDEDGDSKLHLSIIQPNIEVSTWLTVATAVHCPGLLNTQNYEFQQTPLHLAVLTDLPSVVRTLIVCGADGNIRDRNGNTPLHVACRLAKLACIEALTRPVTGNELNQVATYCQSVGLPIYRQTRQILPDLNSTDYEGRSYLHLLQVLQCDSRLVMIDYLVNNCSANINIQECKSGYTLLHLAVKQRDTQLFTYLLQLRTLDVNIATYSRHTAVDIADSLNYTDLVTRLLAVGAKYSQHYVTNDSASSDSDDDEQMDNDYDDLVVGGQRLSLNSVGR